MIKRTARGTFAGGRLSEAGNWKGGRIKRGGYIYIKAPTHPFSGKQGYVAEHRLIMEKSIGRTLQKTEVVHHANGDITDNRLENLVLCSTHGQHTKEFHNDIFLKQRVTFKGRHFSPTTEFKKGDPRLMGNKWNRHFPKLLS